MDILKILKINGRRRKMIDKKYYKRLGGFSYLLDEIRKKIGKEQTETLLDNAVTLCNEFCK